MNTDALKAAKEHNPDTPGKFEAEQKATVYYWHCWLDGDGETVKYNVTRFDVSPEERIALDLVKPRYWVKESESGLVYGGEY